MKPSTLIKFLVAIGVIAVCLAAFADITYIASAINRTLTLQPPPGLNIHAVLKN